MWMKCLAISIFAFAGLLVCSGHEGDGDISYILVEFPEEGLWQVSARLDGEAIFLSFAEGWPNAQAYADLSELYWDFKRSGGEIRDQFLEAALAHIRVEIDGVEQAFEAKFLRDPTFDYRSSKGNSMWGMVAFTGVLPDDPERFQVLFPESYHPLQYEIQVPASDTSVKELLRPRTGQVPRAFLFESGTFAPREVE